jgi:hypothetical protein
MKSVGRFIILALTIAAIGVALDIGFAGVTLEIENGAGQPLRDARVRYRGGEFSVATLREGAILSKRLGKIGEGATFDVDWIDPAGVSRHGELAVYFHGFTGYDTVRIKLLREGRSELIYQGSKYSSEDHLTNR